MIDLAPAADRLRAVARGVTAEDLDGPTPCGDWTVRDLAGHVLGLTLAFRMAADKEVAGAPEQGAQADVVDPGGAWRERLDDRLDALVAAWRQPDAWEGMAEAGGVTMPAAVMAQVAVDELVLHGWDLASATQQPYACDPTSLEAVDAFTAAMSEPEQEEGREGLFGPVVDVPADASTWHRALGRSGRDPAWTP